ncbi:MAG: thiolase family protein [Balneolales bacterium]
MSITSKNHTIVLVDGCRIPFQRSGTGYLHFRAYDLARFAIRGLINRTKIDPGHIDRVIFGSAIQDIHTINVARDAMLGATLPATIPAHTVSMACLSSHQAITSGMEQIKSGQAEVVLAGGVDTLSGYFKRSVRSSRDVPSKKASGRKSKNHLRQLMPFRSQNPLQEIPVTTEFSTGESMGVFTDRMASIFDISRESQDAYAVRSHQSAFRAYENHLINEELVPVTGPPDFDPVTQDNGIRRDCTLQKLASLKPSFTNSHGTVTAGNSSFYSDGAAALLLMTEEKADKLGLEPKARLTHYTYSAQEPKDHLLLGQAYAIPPLLDRVRIKPEDVGVFELHEVFSGQILAVLKALASDDFAKNRLGKKKKVGVIPLKSLNTLGGSLAFGHPFGATGARLVITAANRLLREKSKYALVSSCASGGQGHAMLLEPVSQT